jgi:hypothetical protein
MMEKIETNKYPTKLNNDIVVAMHTSKYVMQTFTSKNNLFETNE